MRKGILIIAVAALITITSLTFLSKKNRQEPFETQSQEENTANRNIISGDRSFQSIVRESKHDEEGLHALSDKELQAFESFLEEIDEESEDEALEESENEEIQPDGSSAEVSQTYDNETTIHAKHQEEMFIKYKEIAKRMKPIVEEIRPIWARYYELTENIEEIGDLIIDKTNRGEDYQPLRKERRRMYEEQAELSATLKPLDERRAQLTNEWQDYLRANYGMTNVQFNETYSDALRLWLKDQ